MSKRFLFWLICMYLLIIAAGGGIRFAMWHWPHKPSVTEKTAQLSVVLRFFTALEIVAFITLVIWLLFSQQACESRAIEWAMALAAVIIIWSVLGSYPGML